MQCGCERDGFPFGSRPQWEHSSLVSCLNCLGNFMQNVIPDDLKIRVLWLLGIKTHPG